MFAGRSLHVTALPPVSERQAMQALIVSDSSAQAAVTAANAMDCQTATKDLQTAAASAIQTGGTHDVFQHTSADKCYHMPFPEILEMLPRAYGVLLQYQEGGSCDKHMWTA